MDFSERRKTSFEKIASSESVYISLSWIWQYKNSMTSENCNMYHFSAS